MLPLFITGIGTDIGKTVVAAILAEALEASYWKPVQAGFDHGTDSQWIAERISHPRDRIRPETYMLSLPASPHIAARKEGLTIDLDRIAAGLRSFSPLPDYLIIEGAGGLLAPLNDTEFVIDLIKKLGVPTILVSRNYLGSINHSLMTAALCKAHNIPVAGWIFNDQYGHYEEDIVQWTGLPSIASIPRHENPDSEFISSQAENIRASLLRHLGPWLARS